MSTRLDLPPHDLPPHDLPPHDLPPAPIEERGGDSEWIELTKARNDIDAHLLVGRLAEGGVETRTIKDRRAPGTWIYAGSNPWAPVAVLVRRFQLDDARLILAEISLHAPDAQVPAMAGRPRRRRPTLLWWVTALVLGALFTALALAQMANSMGSCQLPIFCDKKVSAHR
jgi:Putative prokaryotic signal transducing protein